MPGREHKLDVSEGDRDPIAGPRAKAPYLGLCFEVTSLAWFHRGGVMRVRVGAVGLIVVGLSNMAAAQRPNAQLGRFEVPGMDWAPNSAWRARAALVRANRWAAIQRGDFGALNGHRQLFSLQGPGSLNSFSVTGTFFVPVVAIAYNNIAVAYPLAEFQSVLFGTPPPNQRPYTLKSYYEQISNGRIQVFGRVFESVQVDSSNTFYENGCNGIGVRTTCADGGRRFGNMLIAALDSVSNRAGGDTIWTQFDNDGRDGLPNSGDDDGDVDFVTFLQPTVDGACGAPGVWAHRFVISGWNNGSKYVTKTPRKNAPGQFLRVDNYTMQSQVGGASGCSPDFIMPIGTVSHETGHAFGLPDLYDTDVAGSGTEGIGEWGIMGSGNYSRAYSPTGYDAWSLNELGWVTVDTLNATRTVTTGARQISDTIFLARLAANNELLLIENRQAVESDTAALNPAAGGTAANCRSNCRKGPGLLLWHIDLGRIASGRPSNRINTGPIQGVALEQADGLNNLRSSGSTRNRGDVGDAYPGATGSTKWSLMTFPAAKSNFGEYAGFIIDRIEPLANQAMRFRFLRRDPSVVRSALLGASVRVNDQIWGRFEEVIPQGEPLRLDADSVQDVLTGRTRARFLAWSVGGPRRQVITSGVKPDTITASFAADYRLQVAVAGLGQGTVTANRSGDLGTGIFVAEGTPVVVTATPAAGSLFVGWRGDSTLKAPTFTVPMGRPYDLEASFVVELQIAVADATTEILGTAKLTSDQKLFLDQLGNRNGLYDVGDYLALLKRSGQAVSPELMRAIAAARSTKTKGTR